MSVRTPRTFLTIRISPALRERAHALADANGRSLSQEVRWRLTQAIAENDQQAARREREAAAR